MNIMLLHKSQNWVACVDHERVGSRALVTKQAWGIAATAPALYSTCHHHLVNGWCFHCVCLYLVRMTCLMSAAAAAASVELQMSLQIDAGSSSPGDQLTRLSLSPSGPFALGQHTVRLTISDSQQSDSCSASIIVQVQRPSCCP